jgi:hypothetical protein
VPDGNVLALQSTEAFAGHVKIGGLLSETMMLCMQLLLLPHASVATQVRIIVNSCGQIPAVVASVKPIIGAVSQLSVTVGVPVPGGNVLPLQSTDALAGHVKIGGLLSIMVMVCVQLKLFPLASVAVHVRVIIDD